MGISCVNCQVLFQVEAPCWQKEDNLDEVWCETGGWMGIVSISSFLVYCSNPGG